MIEQLLGLGAEELLGPLAGYALALAVLSLFLRGTILSRNTVPREDYEKVMDVNASYAEALPLLTTAVNEAIALARSEREKNGGL